MCDSICRNEKKYVLGPAPTFLSNTAHDLTCATMEDYATGAKSVIKNIVQETTINVPKIEYKEKIVHVPRVEYRTYPVIKDVERPIYQDRYRYKNVEIPQKKLRVKPVYKVVDVPNYKYVNKYVKRKYKRFQYVPKEVQVPFRPRREIYTEIPTPRYIPQYVESGPITPEHFFNNSYNNEKQLPLFEGYNDNFLSMMNPFSKYNNREKGNCFLSCLCNGKNEESIYEMDPLLFSSAPYTHSNYNSCDMEKSYEFTPESYNMLPFNTYPLVIHKRKNNFYDKMIETTSSLLAAAGVSLILAGKLSIQGISLLLGGNEKKEDSIKGTYTNADEGIPDNNNKDTQNKGNQIEGKQFVKKSDKKK
ncbi:hypothetical protein, conserved [Plasmodium gonderi]|uniref:Inner membrane complex protein 1m n=1 Tax=Plasmodium gonderi TaxID=77519 RepID=A0A1Y1JBU4_PLAGO|nr:hypothetical protein, conserved [Plasmodium gonderi]GAW79989.1 hypothetical protein, conserved [Plasmodium gonderi]